MRGQRGIQHVLVSITMSDKAAKLMFDVLAGSIGKGASAAIFAMDSTRMLFTQTKIVRLGFAVLDLLPRLCS